MGETGRERRQTMQESANNPPAGTPHRSAWERLAGAIVAHRRRVLAVWLLLFAAAIPPAIELQDHLTPTRTIAGTESAYVDAVIAERFGRDTRQGAVLILPELRPVHEPADKDLLKSVVDTVRSWPEVVRASSIIDLPRGLMVGVDGVGAIVTVQFEPDADATALEVALRGLRAEVAAQAAGREPAPTLYWTGNFFLHADVKTASKQGARLGEIMALPLSLMLLVAIFGSIRAALCPVLSAVVAVAASVGFAGLMTMLLPWSPSVLMQNVISLIGLALTIDYSLLTVNRFRNATERGLEPRAALVSAAADAAPTIFLAGFSVLLGFAALFMVPVEEIRAIGAAGALASVFAAVVSTTLMPAFLALFAPRLARAGGLAAGARARRFFAGLARAVCRRPVGFLLVSAVPLVLLALPLQDIRITAHNESWLPQDTQSTRGVQALTGIGRLGLANEILVVAEAPRGDHFLSATGWRLAHATYERLALLEHVESVIALPRSMSAKLKPETLQNIPRRTLDPLLSPDNRTMLFRVIPAGDLDYLGTERLVRTIRALDDDPETAQALPAVSVGGGPASTVDYVGIVGQWMPYVIGLVILGAFLVLAVAFRSPVVAFKAVLLNLFSVSAAFGLATLVFLEGHGGFLIGVWAPVDGMFPAMPLLVFCAVFGVSMDYEVFLISRIAAARRVETGETAAIVRGISETGMVITFAAAIMILVFGAFTVTSFLPAKMLGFTLAAAVFFDATIVRVMMSPALMRLAGRWNWWPWM